MGDLIATVASLLPAFFRLVGQWMSTGKDPKAELDALLDSEDVAAEVAARTKFGGG